MNIPYYNPRRRAVALSALLLAVLALLVCTGLGILRLSLSGSVGADADESGRLFTLALRGANVFDPRAGDGFGSLFWTSRVLGVALALALPWCRIVIGALLAALAAAIVTWLHFETAAAVPAIPLEFELLILFVITSVWALTRWACELADRRRFSRLLGQYVPPELAAAYSRHPETMGLAGESREVTVLFCDIVNFSAISESMEPAETGEWLNGFFEVVSRITVRHRGTIDKLMGDSVMAVWGAPARSRSHAFDALSAALDIERELAELNARYIAAGLPPLSAGMGLSTGEVNVGPLGSAYRMDYTVVGDSVNVAQRLEKQTRKYHVPIIVSDSTAEALPDVLFRELDTVAVTGRATPVTMYAPVGPAAGVDAETRERLALHDSAMAASKAGDWQTARAAFTTLRDGWGPAPMYALYLRGIDSVAPPSD